MYVNAGMCVYMLVDVCICWYVFVYTSRCVHILDTNRCVYVARCVYILIGVCIFLDTGMCVYILVGKCRY